MTPRIPRFVPLAAGLLVIALSTASTFASAWWRFENNGEGKSEDGNLELALSPTAVFSSDVPGQIVQNGGEKNPNSSSLQSGNSKEGGTLNAENSQKISRIIETSSFTIEAFIKMEPSPSPHQYERIIGNIGKDVSEGGWCLLVIGNYLVFEGVSTLKKAFGSVRSDAPLVPDVWQHVAVVGTRLNNRLSISLYVNGKEQESTMNFYAEAPGEGTILPCTNNISIGAPNPFNGLIDELKITDDILEPAQFLTVSSVKP